jgi:hypothetical protein
VHVLLDDIVFRSLSVDGTLSISKTTGISNIIKIGDNSVNRS